jgi:hypothetical protein
VKPDRLAVTGVAGLLAIMALLAGHGLPANSPKLDPFMKPAAFDPKACPEQAQADDAGLAPIGTLALVLL